VEKAKMLESMQAKRKRKMEETGVEGSDTMDAGKGFTKHFKQKAVMKRAKNSNYELERSEEVQTVLSKIF
jgi:hypothetical protein